MTDLSDFIRREHEPMVRDLRGQITRANVALRDLREQLQTLQTAANRVDYAYRHKLPLWQPVTALHEVLNPASSYDGLVEPPEADSDVCHNDAQSPAKERL